MSAGGWSLDAVIVRSHRWMAISTSSRLMTSDDDGSLVNCQCLLCISERKTSERKTDFVLQPSTSGDCPIEKAEEAWKAFAPYFCERCGCNFCHDLRGELEP
jgi:hypothetical protein